MEKQVIYSELSGQAGEYLVKLVKRVEDFLASAEDEAAVFARDDFDEAKRISIFAGETDNVKLALDGDTSYSIRINESHDSAEHRYYDFSLIRDEKEVVSGTVRHRL